MRAAPAAVRWPEALLAISLCLHVLVVPFTKVEESFSLTAVRDILLHGIAEPQRFDHVEFAGAVPRSFVGPVALAAAAALPLRVASACGLVRSGLGAQITIRLTLAVASALSLIYLARSVRAAYGAKVAKYFLLLSATQFHVPFWAGRTLPNMLAFPLVQVAIALFVRPPVLASISQPRPSTRLHLLSGFSLLTFAAVVMRLEVAALLAPFALEHLVRGLIDWRELLVTGTIAAAASLALSVIVDSHFWQTATWLWPEGHAFFFNVVEGKSAEWGVSPPGYYFMAALPKLLHLSLLPAALSLFSDRRTRRLVFPCLAFVALLSGLEHKEWRFIVYVVPALTVAAAAGIVAVGSFTASRLLRRSLLLCLLGVNALQTLLGLAASSANYPGAAALAFLESHLPPASSALDAAEPWRVYVTPAAKMTGASNFLLGDSDRTDGDSRAWYIAGTSRSPEEAPRVRYDRSEPRGGSPDWSAYDFALVGAFDGEGSAVAEKEEEKQPQQSPSLPLGADILYTATEFAGWDVRAFVHGRWAQVRRTREAVRVVRLPNRKDGEGTVDLPR